MSDTIKGAIIGAVITALTSVVLFFWADLSTQSTLEKSTVETLSTYYDFIDENMSLNAALASTYEYTKEAEREKASAQSNSLDMEKELQLITAEYNELKSEINDLPNTENKSADIVLDGLKVHEGFNDAILLKDETYYYSQKALETILEGHLSYNATTNTILYSETIQNHTTVTAVDLLSTDVLYDGNEYSIYRTSDANNFSMGSKTYNEGITMNNDRSLFGGGDGYTLYDLGGEYSKISFDVGRTNEYEKQDVILQVYLDDTYSEEFSLNALSPPVNLEIDLKYANNLQLKISGGSRVKYGFANILLHY